MALLLLPLTSSPCGSRGPRTCGIHAHPLSRNEPGLRRQDPAPKAPRPSTPAARARTAVPSSPSASIPQRQPKGACVPAISKARACRPSHRDTAAFPIPRLSSQTRKKRRRPSSGRRWMRGGASAEPQSLRHPSRSLPYHHDGGRWPGHERIDRGVRQNVWEVRAPMCRRRRRQSAGAERARRMPGAPGGVCLWRRPSGVVAARMGPPGTQPRSCAGGG